MVGAARRFLEAWMKGGFPGRHPTLSVWNLRRIINERNHMKETPALTDTELESILGPVAIMDYRKAPDYDKPKIAQWVAGLAEIPDADFISETAGHILDAAISAQFPRQNSYGIDCRVTACYEEAKRRHVAAGHSEDCRGETLYITAYARAVRDQGYDPGESPACTCGAKEKGK
jgi:rhodanese-related sulfurtransferase